MAQRLEILNLDSYKIRLNDSANFTIDTGANLGTVNITGSLNVTGNITQTEINEVVVKDRTITLNDGETGQDGISISPSDGTRYSGLIIDRNEGNTSNFDAYFIFDEEYNSIPNPGVTEPGAFIFKDGSNSLRSIFTNAIRTFGNDPLVLLGEGTGIVTVAGTSDYWTRVFPYTGTEITPFATNPDKLSSPIDQDALITSKILIDYVRAYHDYNYQDRISFADLTSSTFVRIYDNEVDPLETSRVAMTINGSNTANVYEDRLEIDNLRFSANTITSRDLIGDVRLAATGTGSVVFATQTKLPPVADPASPPDQGNYFYAKDIGDGGSGLYFYNEDGTQDELASRNKALLFSIIF